MDIIKTVEAALGAEREVFCIGKSVCGNDILCAHCGSAHGKQIIITAAIHARECYTALVVLRQIREFAARTDGGVYFVPLVNPDGALFFESGNPQGSAVLENNVALCKEWKANANGVDLNCNFDANWGTGRYNKRARGASDYIGEYPLCEPETRALAEFTKLVKPSATVSYHCMGGELYWQFFQTGGDLARDRLFASSVAEHIGVIKVDGDLSSAGGYKDHCVKNLHIPAVTVELIASGSHPFAPRDFERDIEKNRDLPAYILEILDRE